MAGLERIETENGTTNEDGLMVWTQASINDASSTKASDCSTGTTRV
ncbi:MAG: hypothetical protein ACI841_003382 [Planctomycetota bacterium]